MFVLQFLIILAFVIVVQGIVVDDDKSTRPEDFDPNPQYTFGYEIQGDLTGDSKMQHEIRDGDVIKGIYSFIEADGTRRTVEYTADPRQGFNAIIRRDPAPDTVKTNSV